MAQTGEAFRRYGIAVAVVLVVLGALMTNSVSAASYVSVQSDTFSALSSNPAGIGVGEPGFRLVLMPLDLVFLNNTLGRDTLLDYIGEDLGEIGDALKEDFLAALPAEGFQFDLAGWNAVQLGMGSLSVNGAVRTLGAGTVAKDGIDLFLDELELGREYVLDGSQLGGVAFGDASVGVSLGLGNLRLGGRYHHLLGAFYSEATIVGGGKAVLDAMGDLQLDGTVTATVARTDGDEITGHGAAYDLGAIFQVTDRLAIGFAVMDMGGITWEEVFRETFEGKADPSGDGGLEFDTVDASSGGTLEWQLPRRYEASLGYKLAKSLHLGVAYVHTEGVAFETFQLEPQSRVQGMLSWNGLGILPMGVGAVYSEADGLSLTGEVGLRLGPIRARARVTDYDGLGVGFDLGIVF